MNKNCKKFEVYNSKSLDFLEQTDNRNIVVNSARELSEEHSRKKTILFYRISRYFKQMVDRNTGVKGASGEDSDGNEKYIIGYLRKSNPCYKVATSLAELCLSPNVLWKVEFTSETRYLAEEISKQNVSSLVPPDYV